MEYATYRSDARGAITAARVQAAGEGKRVAVVFGSDWCPDCEAFKAALSHRLVSPILDQPIALVFGLFSVFLILMGRKKRPLIGYARD